MTLTAHEECMQIVAGYATPFWVSDLLPIIWGKDVVDVLNSLDVITKLFKHKNREINDANNDSINVIAVDSEGNWIAVPIDWEG